jgi:hypothetical protein
VLEPPLPVEVVDSPLGVLADRARPLVRPESGVVVRRVVREVRRDEIRVAGVQCLVVAADVIEIADRRILSDSRMRGRPVARTPGAGGRVSMSWASKLDH